MFTFFFDGYTITANLIMIDDQPSVTVGSEDAPVEVLLSPAVMSAAHDALLPEAA